MLQRRAGLAGFWDQVVGPGMSAAETATVLTSGLVASAFVFAERALMRDAWWLALICAVVAFDVVGGAVCNATETTKAWYARPGQGKAQRLMFVLPHIGYVALIAWLWRPGRFDLAYFLLTSGALLASTLALLASPERLKRPMAFALYLASLSLVLAFAGPTKGLEWFLPALLLKLLVGYLVPSRGAPSSV